MGHRDGLLCSNRGTYICFGGYGSNFRSGSLELTHIHTDFGERERAALDENCHVLL